MAAAFELKKAAGEKYSFNLKAGNGQVILTSQPYSSKQSAQAGIESVRKNATDDARFERKESKKGEPYFVLNAANGEVLGRSEMYSSATAMENGIGSVQKNAPDAQVKDLA